MKVNEINDIEILREALKKTMIEIKETFTHGGCTFNKGEFYHIEQDPEAVYLFDDNGELVILDYEDAKKYLE
jgi:hypothetical protein